MIFVTVGTDEHDFSRLVKKMDELPGKNVMQIGHTKYEPKKAEWFRFEKNSVIEGLYKKADIIVTHGGAGSIIRSLKGGKVPIVVPRLKKHGEHLNDHQLDLARGLEGKGRVVLVEDVELLGKMIKRRKASGADCSLAGRIESFLVEHEKKIS